MKKLDKVLHNHLFEYFTFHGNQRITLFRYYIVFTTLYLTGLAFLTRGFHCAGTQDEIITIITSTLFICATWIFDKLDRRNMELIDHSKEALIKFEDEIFQKDQKNRLFSEEKNKSKERSHRECFEIMFGCGQIISIVFIAWAAFSFCDGKDNCSTKQIEITNLAPWCPVQ
jgi:hypothetical protein